MGARLLLIVRRQLRRLAEDQSGITGLETAIVLIAFVVVAAVFAFTVLTTGLFTSEKAKETALKGVSSAGGSLELIGGVVAGGTNIGTTCDTAEGPTNPPLAPIITPPYQNQTECDIDWNEASPHVQTLRFRLGLALGVSAIPFDPNNILVTYQDEEISRLLPFAPVRTVLPGGNRTDVDIRTDTAANIKADWTACRAVTTSHFCIRWSPNADRDFVLEPGETVEIIITCMSANDPLHDELNQGDRFRIEVLSTSGGAISFDRRFPDTWRWVMNLE